MAKQSSDRIVLRTKGKPKVKVGDIVQCLWTDIVSYPRLDEVADDGVLPLAEFTSYGTVSYIGEGKITIRHECEVTNPERIPTREPTVYPVGCVKKLVRLRLGPELRLK